MRIVTNAPRFPSSWTTATGGPGWGISASSAAEFRRYQAPDVVWVVNCDPALTFQLASGRRLPALVAVDLVLRRPAGLKACLTLPWKRWLLSQVDYFLHYFRDWSGLEEVYGLPKERSAYVPFKANLTPDQVELGTRLGEGEYVLCFGRSLRDFDTFFAAMEQLPYTGAIAEPNYRSLREHGARFTRPLQALPKNVRVLSDTQDWAAQARILGGARLVVLPILRSSIVASGISTCLNAMAIGKCVIGTKGPGFSDIFTDEVLVSPPEDAKALAATIRHAWNNDAVRRDIAERGRRLAQAWGSEQDLYRRWIEAIVELTAKGKTR